VRREVLRGAHALAKMDPAAHPWHAFGFRLWLEDFLWPSIHDHHDNEEHIVGPHYAALGEKPDWGGDAKNHQGLLELMDRVSRDAADLVAAAPAAGGGGSEQGKKAVSAALDVLRRSWAALQAYMEEHLALEEKVWPEVYKKFGQMEEAKVMDKILAVNMAKKGKEAEAFQSFLGSIWDGLGVDLAFPGGKGRPPAPSHALQMAPWCDDRVGRAFLAPIPWVPKALIFPGWQRKYITVWKALVDSLSGPDNVLGVTERGIPSSKVCCTVM
jgi:hypothetical protein